MRRLPQVHYWCDNALTGHVVIADPLQKQSVTQGQDAVPTMSDIVYSVLLLCMLFHWSISWSQIKQQKLLKYSFLKIAKLILSKKN